MTQAFERVYKILFLLFGIAIITSMAAMEILSSLILLTGLIHIIKNKTSLSFVKKEIFLFLLLFITSIASLAFNNYLSEIPRTMGWFRWIFIFYAITYGLMQSNKNILNLFLGVVVGITVSGLNSIHQSITQRDWTRGNKVIDYFADIEKQITRVTGFFNLPTTYGYVIAMALLVPILLFFLSQNQKQKIVSAFSFILGVGVLTITYSRGAWIAFAAGLFCFILFTRTKILLPILATGAIAGSILFFVSPGFQERVHSLSDLNYYSNYQRIELWRANWEIFKDHPIIGSGLNQNDKIVEEYHDRLNHIERFRSHAHNSYLQYLAGTGIIGFLSFVSVLFFFLWQNFQWLLKSQGKQKLLSAGLLSIQVTFLVSCLFDCNFGDSEVRYSFLTYLATFTAVSRSNTKLTSEIF